MGVYAIVSGLDYIFIGKAKRGKGIFREAKENRETEYWKGLRKQKIVMEEKPAWYKLRDTVYRECRLYAGVVLKEEFVYIEDVEKLLVYHMKPVCNEKYVNKLEISEGLQLINVGTLPPGLNHEVNSPN